MNMENTAGVVPPLQPKLRVQLSVMMFLQYAIWGAWLPLFFGFLTNHRGFSSSQAGTLFAIAAIGALLAPFIAGQIADRYFATQKFLGISHILGAVLVWQLGTLETYGQLLVFGLLYSIIYAPTLSLTNSLAFHHVPDRDRDFGRVRVWGTVGWIIVGICMGQWLLRMHIPDGSTSFNPEGAGDAFKLSAILGFILGVYCFFLPNTPPKKTSDASKKFAAIEALGEVRRNPLLTLFLVTFPISCIHQFYFVRTADFLDSLQVRSPWIDTIFGVGGGPMTIGQISEMVLLALMPFFAKSIGRKWLLAIGISAYALRFAVFAYLPYPAAVFPALALHGVCFGFFFFIAFIVVDEETTADVRASSQSLFNFIVVGLGVIVGNYAAGVVGGWAMIEGTNVTNYQLLFSIPMWVAIACLIAHLIFYPTRKIARHPD